VANEQDHSTGRYLVGARGLDFPEYRTTEFLSRVADYIDGQMLDLEQRLAGSTLDTLGSFLPTISSRTDDRANTSAISRSHEPR